MRTLLRLVAALGIAAFFAAPARADDTRPPVISDVKAVAKGGNFIVEAKITDETGVLSATCFHRKGGSGKFEESSMVKDEYDDGFKVSFPGSAETEYFIQATDLLGNGPSSFGAASKPMALGGAKPRQEKAEPPPRQPQESEVAQERPHHQRHHHASHASTEAKPAIEHRVPTTALADGKDATLHVHIAANPQVLSAGAFARTAGTKEKPTEFPMKNSSDDTWDFTIPAALAHGSLEYILLAKNALGQTTQGNGDDTTWYKITFKPPPGPAQQPLLISHNPPTHAVPGKPVVLRAQVSPPDIATMTEDRADAVNAQMFGTTARILFRGQDGVDQVVDMGADPSGGLGGYKSEIPSQPDGSVIYYQIVACDNSGEKCAIDTGSKRKWHALRVTSSPGGTPPQPISAVSTKAPASLPE